MTKSATTGRFFNRWLLGLLIVFAFALLLRNSFGYLDPDFGWHYQVGQEIWQNRQIPRIEHHIFPVAGQHWVDHEWLSNLLVFLIKDTGGYLLLSLLFAGLIIATWWLLARSTIRHWLDDKASCLSFWSLLIIGLTACLPHFGIRIQEVTVFFLLVLNLWLGKITRQQAWQTWEMAAVPLLFWLWACLHGGFLIGLAVIIAWTLFRIILYFWQRRRPSTISPTNLLPPKAIKQSIIVIILSVIVTCLTPYGLRLYSFLADYQGNRAYLLLIQEWLPITEDILSWRMLYCLIFAIALVLLHFCRRSKVANDQKVSKWLWQQDWWPLLLSIIMFIAAWRSLRHFPLFVIVSLPWLAGFYYRYFSDEHFYPNRWPIYLKWFVSIIIILTITVIFLDTRWTNQPAATYCTKYPCSALKYLRQSPYRHWPTIVDYAWGGYFYWQWPEKPIFIDGRLPQYPWRDRTLIEHYSRFAHESDIKAALNDYDLSVIVLAQPRQVRFNWLETWLLGRGQQATDYEVFQTALRRAMLKLPNWRLVYSDPTATIYVRQ